MAQHLRNLSTQTLTELAQVHRIFKSGLCCNNVLEVQQLPSQLLELSVEGFRFPLKPPGLGGAVLGEQGPLNRYPFGLYKFGWSTG